MRKSSYIMGYNVFWLKGCLTIKHQVMYLFFTFENFFSGRNTLAPAYLSTAQQLNYWIFEKQL